MNTLKRVPRIPLALLAFAILALGLTLVLRPRAHAQTVETPSPSANWLVRDTDPNATPTTTQPDETGCFSMTVGTRPADTGYDLFHYVYQPLTGDGQMVARVLGIGGTNQAAQAGVMIRETFDYGSRHALMLVTAGSVTRFHYWPDHFGTEYDTIASTNQPGPCWVKVVRAGNWVGGYTSVDGGTWTLVDWTVMTNLAPQVYMCLAAANQSGTSSPCTATFDQVSVGPVDASVMSPVAGAAKPSPIWQQSMQGVNPPSPLPGDANGWWHVDIGWGAFSDASASAGTFAVTSSGREINYGRDSFHFVYQPLTGDGQIVARVLEIQGPNPAAQAGVMIRETFEPNSRHATMLANSSSGTAFQSWSAPEGLDLRTAAGTNQAAPRWVKVVRLGNWLGGYTSQDGANWVAVDWAVMTNLPSQLYVGLVVAASPSTISSLTTAWFDQVSVGPVDTSGMAPEPGATKAPPIWQQSMQRVSPPAPLPGDANGWWHADIGGGAYSDASSSAGTFTVASSGREIGQWGSSFHYVYQPLLGDGQLVARVLDIRGTNLTPKAGLMIREGLEPDARHTMVLTTKGWGTSFQCWPDPEGLGFLTATATNQTAPRWLKVVRLGNWVGGYTSSDGVSWTSVDWTVMTNLPAQIYVGLAVASQSKVASLTTASFDQVSLGPPDLAALSAEPGAAKEPPIWQQSMQWADPPSPLWPGDTNGWWHADIGRGAYSDASFSEGTFEVTGSAREMAWAHDSLHYVYQPLTGDGQIVARVLELQATNQLAKAGVMVRETMLEGNSRYAAMLVSKGWGTFFQWRARLGGLDSERRGGRKSEAAPYWVKLARTGDCLSGYASPDGTNWTLLYWAVLTNLAPQVQIGLAAESFGDKKSLITAWLDHVSMGPVDSAARITPLEGTGDGLLGSYYPDSCLYGPPVTTYVDAAISFFWLHGEPMGLVNGAPFGVCWSGEVQAQFTEPYTFYLYSRHSDWVRLWLNGQLIIDTWKVWHGDGERAAAPVNLVAGQRYLLRVEFFNNSGEAAASLSWSSPSTPKFIVPQNQLYSQPTDSDGSGLPDTWQRIFFGHLGVDPTADPDGDGLSNLEEYRHNTNPLKADTDGDGMPDGWEVAHRLNPTYNDAGESLFQDGLSNLQKYQAGIDPNQEDTGGTNGLPFGLVVNYLGINPTNAGSLATVVAAASGAQGQVLLGSWQANGTDLYALSRGGELEFDLSVPTADKYVLKVVGTQNQPTAETTLSLLVSIDGESFGHRTLYAPYGANGVLDLVTPYLLAGTHTVLVRWDGDVRDSVLRLKQVELLSVAGPSSGGNGIKDWVVKMVADESGLDLANGVIGSYTSPDCLEGRDPYVSMMQVSAGTVQAGMMPVATNRGPNNRWYANVPLSAGANTVTLLNVTYQNGALAEQRSLQWLPVNLFSAGELVIRKGDSLLLAATPQGALAGSTTITVGTNQLTAAVGSPVAYQFSQAGVFTVAGVYTSAQGATQSGSLGVTVVDYSFPNDPDCSVDQEREWDLTNVPPAVVVQADSRMICEQTGTLPDNGRQMSLLIDQPDPRMILARVGTNGPVVAAATTYGFQLLSDNDTYDTVVATYPDGSRLVQTVVDVGTLPPGAVVVINIVVAGVTFDDGTLTKVLTAADFDALGQCVLRFIWPAGAQGSICHTTTVLQNGTVIR